MIKLRIILGSMAIVFVPIIFMLTNKDQYLHATSMFDVYEKPYPPGYGSTPETQINNVLLTLEPTQKALVTRDEIAKDYKYYEIEFKNKNGESTKGFVIYGLGSFVVIDE